MATASAVVPVRPTSRHASSLLEPLAMDSIALISDLHGNIPALEAVLRDIKRRNISRIFCLGDLVGKGPHADKVVDICQDVCEVTIKGNWDDLIVRDTEKPTLLWHQQRLGPERLAYLRQLPQTIAFWMSGRRVRLFHASQESVYYRVRMEDAREKLLAMFTNTAFTGNTCEPDVVGYGDIYCAFVMPLHQQMLFNVGSVGNPLDMPQASYAIIEGTYNLNVALTKPKSPCEPHKIRLTRHQAAARACRSSS